MKTLTSAERRAHRSRAHSLHPVVSIGAAGLSVAVLHEIDLALRAHELIKIRIFSADRTQRGEWLDRICHELGAAPVQHLGKILVVYRPAPEAETPVPARAAVRPASAKATAKAPARKRTAQLAAGAAKVRNPRRRPLTPAPAPAAARGLPRRRRAAPRP